MSGNDNGGAVIDVKRGSGGGGIGLRSTPEVRGSVGLLERESWEAKDGQKWLGVILLPCIPAADIAQNCWASSAYPVLGAVLHGARSGGEIGHHEVKVEEWVVAVGNFEGDFVGGMMQG